MKSANSVSRHSRLAALAGMALVGGVLAAPQACFKEIARTCSSLWADTTRVCYNGAVATPCADVVIDSGTTYDVRQAQAGESGRTGWHFESSTTTIAFYKCAGPSNPPQQNCVPENPPIQTKTCMGRRENSSSLPCYIAVP